MKKYFFIPICMISLLLGVIGAYASIKLSIAVLFATSLIIFLFVDYQAVTYILSFYVLIDYFLRNVIKSAALAGNWDEMFFIFCFLIWVYKWFVHRKEKAYRWTPLEFPLLFFMGISVFLALVNSPEIQVGVEGLRAVIEYMIWYFAIVQLIRTEKGAKIVINILVLVGTLLALDGIRQYIVGAEMPGNWTDNAEEAVRRVFSIVGSPNILGSFMILLIPIGITLMLNDRKFLRKVIYAFAVLSMVACLIFTSSRGAWIGFLLAVLVFVLVKDKRLVIPLIAAVVLAFALVPSIQSRITYLLSQQYMDNSLVGGRLGRAITGFKMLGDHPWLGVGLGRFGGAVAMNHKIQGTVYLDNYFLKTAVEMGIVGIAAYFILIYNVLLWVSRTYVKIMDKRNKMLILGILTGMLGVVIHNFFENVFEVPMMNTYFWVLAAIVMYLGYVEKGKADNAASRPVPVQG